MTNTREEAKEIRLFGEKSIREQAYRNKIQQLEQELLRLEEIARNTQRLNHKQTPISESYEEGSELKGVYYNTLTTFDRKAQTQQKILETKANEFSEKLTLQAQDLIDGIEFSTRKVIRQITIAAILLPAIILLIIGAVALFYRVSYTGGKIADVAFIDNSYANRNMALSRRLPHIRTVIDTQTVYHNQYDVTYLDVINGTYVMDIELSLLPTSGWFLKTLAEDLMKTLKRYVEDIPVECSIFYEGKLYCKAYMSGPPQKVRFRFLQ